MAPLSFRQCDFFAEKYQGRPPSRGARPGRFFWFGATAFLTLAFSPDLGRAQDPLKFFKEKCISCHTIGGGRSTGPDLKDVTKRRNREWLVEFILNPKKKIDSDTDAKKLWEEYGGVTMTTFPDMTPELAESLLKLIETESAKGADSEFAKVEAPSEPFTEKDIEEGRKFFLGKNRLANGGPACISCHRVDSASLFGGGQLGPDLTKMFGRKGVYGDYTDRVKFIGWLKSPPAPTMLPIYKSHELKREEILSLVAYLEHSAKEGREGGSVAPLNFFLFGLGGAALGLAAFDAIWRQRLRGVRKVLVRGVEKS